MRRLAPDGWRVGAWLLCSSLALLVCGGAARAAEVTFHGFVSAAYDYNVNQPASGTNAFRVFDINANSFGIDVAEVVVQRAADDKSHVRFRVDVAAGSTVPRVSAARGLFRAADGTGSDFDLQQAFVTVVAPVGRGLRVDAGKFVTAHGYEVIDGYDGYNDNATRSLLFGYAIPFTHTGLKASYTFSPRVAATAMVVNGWDNAVDNNSAKSLGGQLALTPCGSLSVILSGMTGPERDHDNATQRQLLDAVAVWRATSALTLGANYDWGRDTRTPPPGSDALSLDERWKGGAAYLRLHSTCGAALSLRGEAFTDASGVRTGVAQTLKEVTVTPEYAVSSSVVLRADVRRDWSNRASFDKAGVASDHQVTVRGNVVVVF